MKLYDGGRVPNARRVRIFLAEKGIDVPMVAVDLGKSEHRSAEFTALNPLQRVPVLVLDDGTVLTESIAICRYFEELHPTPPLFGTGAKERALVEMWQRRIEFDLYGTTAHAFRHTHPAMASFEVPQVPEWGEANKARVLAFLPVMEQQLDGRTFLCGETMTVADITALIAIDFFKAARITLPDGLPNIRRWHATMSARPSARA